MGCNQSKEKQEKGQDPEPSNERNTSDSRPEQPPPDAVEDDGRDDDVEKDDDAVYKRDKRFANGGPSIEGGTVTPCFQTGLLFRIVKDDTTYFYNDSSQFEAHIIVSFGPQSEIEVLGDTVRSEGENNWGQLKLIVYPSETQAFYRGTFNGYRSKYECAPLSAEYKDRVVVQNRKLVDREMQAVEPIWSAVGKHNEEQALAACVQEGKMFVDITFPPMETSLSRPFDARQLTPTMWMRPSMYLPQGAKARLFRNGAEPDDIDQGQLGDCWFLCSVASVAEFRGKIEDMFRHPVSLNVAEKERAVGAYRVTLNKNGWWHVVIIDDFLPCVGNRPCFAKNDKEENEMWAAFLEKAFAKMHGSYAAIAGGDALHALADLTGYPTSRFDTEWQDALADPNGGVGLFDDLVRYDTSKYLINLNTPGVDNSSYMGQTGASNSEEFEKRYADAGLGMGHAYSVLTVKYFPASSRNPDFRIMKIRNPWGSGAEWTGRWGDNSTMWEKYPHIARECGYTIEKDGTFWMDWEDVKQYFDGGGVCFIKFGWADYRVGGMFESAIPSVVLEVTASEDVEAFITLSQPDRRGFARNHQNAKYAAVMLTVFAGDGTGGYRAQLSSQSDADRPADKFSFIYARDVAMRFEFKRSANPYYIVPRIHESNISKEFVLGLISSRAVQDGVLKVNFRRLAPECEAFRNRKVFRDPTIVPGPLELDCQFNPEVGAPRTTKATGFVNA